MLCAGLTVYSALMKADAKAGQWVVVMGAGGGLGHIAVQLSARAIGHRVIGIDHSSKRDLVLDSGAEHFIAVDESSNIPEDVQKLTGGLGAHAAIVATANNKAYAQSVELLRFRGTSVCVGIPEGKPVPIETAVAALLVAKELKIVGSAVGDRKQAIETLDFAARGIVKTHYRLEKMENLTKVFEEMEQGKMKGRVVLDMQ